MNEASKLIFWKSDMPAFGVRMGRNLSYLDTLCLIDEPIQLDVMFKFNQLPDTEFHYWYSVGSDTWFTSEIGIFDDVNKGAPFFNVSGYGTGLQPKYDKTELYGHVHTLQIKLDSEAFSVDGSWQASWKRVGTATVRSSRSLTIGCCVNRDLQEGLKPTVEAALRRSRVDMTLYALRISKNGIALLDIQPAEINGEPCFRDKLTKNVFKSAGPDPFEFDK